MRSTFATLAFVAVSLLLSTPTSIYGAESAKRIYLNPSKIVFSENGMVYKTSHGNLPLKSIRSDQKGIYTVIKQAKQAEKGMSYCPVCKRFVSDDDMWHWLNH